MENKPKEKASDGTVKKQSSPKAGTFEVGLVTVYLVLLGFFLMYSLLTFWPATTSTASTAPTYSTVIFLARSLSISNEVRLIILVILAGALGSLVHGFRSLFWYVGNRAFARSWILMYIMLPFVGASLSLIFYFVLRGGLFSPQAPVEATSPFGFTGLAGLVGMFSNRAALKLQEIAESVFSTKESTKGEDNVDAKKTTEETKTTKKPEAR